MPTDEADAPLRPICDVPHDGGEAVGHPRPSAVSPGVKRRAAVPASRFSVVVKGKKIKRARYAPVDATACES